MHIGKMCSFVVTSTSFQFAVLLLCSRFKRNTFYCDEGNVKFLKVVVGWGERHPHVEKNDKSTKTSLVLA